MSTQAVYEFVARVNSDPSLSAQVVQAITRNEGSAVLEIADNLGLAFSQEDGQKVWNELSASGELPDELLDAVAGGLQVDASLNKRQV